MDQMMDYIKKVRACARQFLQKEAGYILEKGQLMDQIEEQRRKREDIGKFMVFHFILYSFDADMNSQIEGKQNLQHFTVCFVKQPAPGITNSIAIENL